MEDEQLMCRKEYCIILIKNVCVKVTVMGIKRQHFRGVFNSLNHKLVCKFCISFVVEMVLSGGGGRGGVGGSNTLSPGCATACSHYALLLHSNTKGICFVRATHLKHNRAYSVEEKSSPKTTLVFYFLIHFQ